MTTENTMPEQDEVAKNAVPNPPAEPPVPAALKDVDPEKLAAMRARLKKQVEASGQKPKTESGSEAPEEKKGTTSGKDVDWSEYDLDFNLRHLYPEAEFRMTPQGPKWVAMVDEFFSTSKNWKQYGKTNNSPRSLDKTETEPTNLGEYLNDMLNSPEGWRVVSLLPLGMSDAGVLLSRRVPVVLPDPKPLKKATEVEAPKDGELQQAEDAALKFAAEEGIAVEAPAIEPTTEGAVEGADVE